jgi:hypothetical protein
MENSVCSCPGLKQRPSSQDKSLMLVVKNKIAIIVHPVSPFLLMIIINKLSLTDDNNNKLSPTKKKIKNRQKNKRNLLLLRSPCTQEEMRM